MHAIFTQFDVMCHVEGLFKTILLNYDDMVAEVYVYQKYQTVKKYMLNATVNLKITTTNKIWNINKQK